MNVCELATHRRHVMSPLLLAVALLACGPQGAQGGASVTPTQAGPGAEDAPPGEAHEGETASELAARLARLRARQRGFQAQAATDVAACENLCSLATSICGIQEKLCALADERPADDDYQRLCREAKVECQEAQAACVACVERHSEAPASAESGTARGGHR